MTIPTTALLTCSFHSSWPTPFKRQPGEPSRLLTHSELTAIGIPVTDHTGLYYTLRERQRMAGAAQPLSW